MNLYKTTQKRLIIQKKAQKKKTFPITEKRRSTFTQKQKSLSYKVNKKYLTENTRLNGNCFNGPITIL